MCFDAAEVETYRREPIDRHPSRSSWAWTFLILTSIVKSSLKQFFITQIRRREFVKHCSIHALFEVSATCMRRRRSGRRLKPVARVGDIARSDLIMLVNYASQFERTPQRSGRRRIRQSRAVRGVRKKRHVCNRCGDSIEVTNTPPDNRPLYWCPKCQTRLDWRLLDDTPRVEHNRLNGLRALDRVPGRHR